MRYKLKKHWVQLASKYCDSHNEVTRCWKEIKEKYSSSDRYYHNLSHIENMVELAVHYKSSIKDFDALLFAVFYHDLIYDVAREDNETKSAAIARQRLKQLGAPKSIINRCEQHILATQEHAEAEDRDTQLFLDMDLAILGQSNDTYQKYALNIRKEYVRYPDHTYRQRRKKVLHIFLDREQIYQTQEFRNKYEQYARENIQREWKSLN